ncbi:unnamed protein product, partial [Amoebophrya sp. A120]|eukprot:GSA120T00010164001.1
MFTVSVPAIGAAFDWFFKTAPDGLKSFTEMRLKEEFSSSSLPSNLQRATITNVKTSALADFANRGYVLGQFSVTFKAAHGGVDKLMPPNGQLSRLMLTYATAKATKIVTTADTNLVNNVDVDPFSQLIFIPDAVFPAGGISSGQDYSLSGQVVLPLNGRVADVDPVLYSLGTTKQTEFKQELVKALNFFGLHTEDGLVTISWKGSVSAISTDRTVLDTKSASDLVMIETDAMEIDCKLASDTDMSTKVHGETHRELERRAGELAKEAM